MHDFLSSLEESNCSVKVHPLNCWLASGVMEVISMINQAIGVDGVAIKECKSVVSQYGERIVGFASCRAYMMIDSLNKKVYNGYSIQVPSFTELVQIFTLVAPVFLTIASKVAFYSMIIYFATSMGTHMVAAHQNLRCIEISAKPSVFLYHQRELFLRERERFIAFVQKHEGCQKYGEIIREFVISDLQSLHDITGEEILPLPKLVELYMRSGDSGHLKYESSPGVDDAGTPKSAGKMSSWLRKCT